mmetsp:Transcript_19793/g.55050  ORF Transcript_19793/g.55050 Transcript_19793/m.55050 type:complete len:100 (+) Transcript_19793:731-1030(+)
MESGTEDAVGHRLASLDTRRRTSPLKTARGAWGDAQSQSHALYYAPFTDHALGPRQRSSLRLLRQNVTDAMEDIASDVATQRKDHTIVVHRQHSKCMAK